MIKQLILGLDNGNKNTKSSEGFIGDSGYVKSDVMPVSKHNLLEYGGNYYNVGSNRFSVQLDKTVNDDAFIISLAAIGDALEKAGINDEKVDVLLGTGLPIVHYGKLKGKFRDYFNRKDIRFTYNSREYEIDIDSKVYPQGFAAFTFLYTAYKNVVCNLVDIGGYTVDLMRIENGIINPATCFSLPYGVITLLTSIQQELLKINVTLTESQISDIIMGVQPVIFDIEVKELIQAKTGEYVDNLLSKILELGFELRNANIFAGGGSMLVKGYIDSSNKVKFAEYLDLFSNAKGYKLLLQQELRR
ncbi:ParM/StbA family protein [Candidatus Clostridium radicumherbarum]|uniref:ParM/StbA family protein n=1 Tax=Candidatus Clostridium radicumherbarum TaxID=3381662 RepID=A0ABW8TWT7_9CLOT